MPKLNIAGIGNYQTEAGERLINALRRHVDIGHRCGGFARCTTCRVRFVSGEPSRMTVAEKDKLEQAAETGNFRLACQLEVEHDMELEVLMRVAEQPWPDAGTEPADEIEPEPEWVDLG